jgi:hypothetical protein
MLFNTPGTFCPVPGFKRLYRDGGRMGTILNHSMLSWLKRLQIYAGWWSNFTKRGPGGKSHSSQAASSRKRAAHAHRHGAGNSTALKVYHSDPEPDTSLPPGKSSRILIKILPSNRKSSTFILLDEPYS